jgi:hypothetical protein
LYPPPFPAKVQRERGERSYSGALPRERHGTRRFIEMATQADIQQQCFDLITERWPNMPRTWRRLKARQASGRWATDQRTKHNTITNGTPRGQEQMAVAMVDTQPSS